MAIIPGMTKRSGTGTGPTPSPLSLVPVPTSPGYLSEGYKDSTRERVDPDPDSRVTHIDHWSGRVDARVDAKAVGLKLTQTNGAPLEPQHVKAVGEHQKALNELRYARAANRPDWVAACEQRVAEWKERILATQ